MTAIERTIKFLESRIAYNRQCLTETNAESAAYFRGALEETVAAVHDLKAAQARDSI